MQKDQIRKFHPFTESNPNGLNSANGWHSAKGWDFVFKPSAEFKP